MYEKKNSKCFAIKLWLKKSSPLKDRYLDVGELCRRELMLLVGAPKPDRPKDRDQTRFDPNPNCRLSMGLTTLSCKKK